MGWLSKLFNLDTVPEKGSKNNVRVHTESKKDACNRLKLVLMHDRTKLSPDTLEKMRDELVEVISRYVDIDKDALELNLESESNTIALVANIPMARAAGGGKKKKKKSTEASGSGSESEKTAKPAAP